MTNVARILKLLREHSGPSYKRGWHQFFEVADMVMRGHLHPSEYFRYGLSRREVAREQLGTYMSNRSHWQDHLGHLNDPAWFALMDNKWFFHMHFQDIVPLPGFIGIYHPAAGVSRSGTPLCSSADLENVVLNEDLRSVVLKPAQGTHGAGVAVISKIEREQQRVLWHTKDGRVRSTTELLRRVGALGARAPGGFLVEECLEQHCDLDEIAPFTVNTLRVVTLLRDDEAVIQIACIRLGRKGSMVDNYSQGGYCAYVDASTGIIGPGKRRATPAAELETRHADSGVTFTDRAVPLWNEVRDVCLRAARSAPGLRTVGWDVVITPAGPVIIEGNRDWGIMMWQAVGGGFLDGERAKLLRSLGVDVDSGLPPVRLVRALSSLFGTWR